MVGLIKLCSSTLAIKQDFVTIRWHRFNPMDNPQFDAPPIVPPDLSHPIPILSEEDEPLVPLPGIPFPKWLMVFTIVTVCAFVFGLSRIGHAFGTGISYEHAKKQMDKGDAASAVSGFKEVLKQYPDSKDVKIDLADAYDKAGDPLDSAELINTFEGTSVSEEQEARLKQIEGSLTVELQKIEAESKEGKK